MYEIIKNGWIAGACPLMRPVKATKSNTFKILERVMFATTRLGGSCIITVPCGFISDLNSIPRVLPLGFHSNSASGAAVLHDFMYRRAEYRKPGVTRKIADLIYRDAMKDNGVRRITAYTYYSFVRLFGWRHYANA